MEKMKHKLDEFRKKLLDDTKRNKLLNYPLKKDKNILFFNDTSLSFLFNTLNNNDIIELYPIPEPKQKELIAHGYLAINENKEIEEIKPEPSAEEWASCHLGIKKNYRLSINCTGSEINKINMLHYDHILNSRLKRYISKDKEASNEVGFNICYLSIGFLKWKIDPTDNSYSYSPLVSIPIKISFSKDTRKIIIQKRDEDLLSNVTLKKKLEDNYQLILPEYMEGRNAECEDSENNNSIVDYFTEITEKILSQKPDWSIETNACITLLNFSSQAMYNDLNLENWSNINNIVIDLISDKENSNSGEIRPIDYGTISDIDSIETETRHSQYPIIFDADSSQHSALIQALDGNNLVIEGPPGTGKSQTIANIIAAFLSSGKKVLFIAEKMTALQVVKTKLDNVGIGDFCLELHSNKTNKKQVLTDLNRTLNLTKKNYPREIESKIALFEEEKGRLIQYVNKLNDKKVGLTELTIHQILCKAVRYQNESEINPNKYHIDGITTTTFTPSKQEELECDLKSFVEQYSQINKGNNIENHIFYGIERIKFDHFDTVELFKQLENWNSSLKNAQETFDDFITNSISSYSYDVALDEIQSFSDGVKMFPDLEGNELFSLLSYLQENQGAFECYVDTYEDIYKEKCKLIKIFKDNTLNINKYSDIAMVIENFKNIGIKEETILASIVDDTMIIKELNEEISLLKNVYQTLIPNLPDELHELFILSSKNVNKFKIFITHLEGLSDHLWRLRHDDWIKDEFDSNLIILSQVLPELKEQHNFLKQYFLLDKLPRIDVLEHYNNIIQNKTIFSYFTSEWQDMKRELKRIINPISGKVKVFELIPILIEYVKGINQLNEHNFLGNNSFNGLDTPINDLIHLRNWYKSIIASYGRVFGENTKFSKVLMSLDSEILIELKQQILINIQPSLKKVDNLLIQLSKKYTTIQDLISPQNVNQWWGDRSPLYIFSKQLQDSIHLLKDNLNYENISVSQLSYALKRLNSLYKVQECWNSNQVKEMLENHGYIFSLEKEKYDNEKFEVLRRTQLLISGINTNIWLNKLFVENPTFEKYKEVISFNVRLSEKLQACLCYENKFCELGQVDITNWKKNCQTHKIKDIYQRNQEAINHKEELTLWCDFIQFNTYLVDKWNLSVQPEQEPNYIKIDKYISTIKAIIFNQLAQKIVGCETLLRDFNLHTYEKSKCRFIELDKEILKLKQKVIVAEIQNAQKCVEGNNRGRVGSYTESSLINYYAKQKSPRISIRDLITRAPITIQSLKPCFMMSPMSVAQYLTPEKIGFDVVIMDEASQIEPVNAIGSIMRGKQLIVVGDPKQLPPTNFFRSSSNDGQNDDENIIGVEDAESILGVVSTLFDNRQLKWHYRSRHESLIEFSNHQFYDSNLIIFPSPQGETADLGIKYHYVKDGCFVDSKNRREAEDIIKYVTNHIETSNDSIGIVAMNSSQKELLEDLWENTIINNPNLLKKAEQNEDSNEPLFIKNLENVQGDERDVIVISMTYGAVNIGERVMQRFGPINNVGGERRLNVLFTRAKKRMVVFSSMKHDDIREGAGKGCQALRDFLYYCEHKRLPSIKITGKAPDSDFEIAVMDMLLKEGFTCEAQLGVSGYFIDLAVRDPNKPSRYIMAIECDGASYHSSKTARDRDRLRQEILESHGWKVRRIWSTKWFENPELALRPIVEELKEIVNSTPYLAEDTEDELIIDEIPKSTSKKLSLEEKLRQFDNEVIRKCNENISDEEKLLTDSIISILIEDKPITHQEFLSVIPLKYREKIHPEEGKFIGKVLKIIADY